jgi:hypothetical protein
MNTQIDWTAIEATRDARCADEREQEAAGRTHAARVLAPAAPAESYYFDEPGDGGGSGGFDSTDLTEIKARAQEVADRAGRMVLVFVAYPNGYSELYTDVQPTRLRRTTRRKP